MGLLDAALDTRTQHLHQSGCLRVIDLVGLPSLMPALRGAGQAPVARVGDLGRRAGRSMQATADPDRSHASMTPRASDQLAENLACRRHLLAGGRSRELRVKRRAASSISSSAPLFVRRPLAPSGGICRAMGPARPPCWFMARRNYRKVICDPALG
jgi:hypothetical protein